MANFGTHFAYPTPDWVAYRKADEVARATENSGDLESSPIRRIAHAFQRLARAWVRAHEYNAYR